MKLRGSIQLFCEVPTPTSVRSLSCNWRQVTDGIEEALVLAVRVSVPTPYRTATGSTSARVLVPVSGTEFIHVCTPQISS